MIDPILDLMRELNEAMVLQEELEESGDLEDRLEIALRIEDLEKQLLTARLKEGE